MVTVGPRQLEGFGRVVGHSVSQEYFAGRIAEIPLGTPLVIDPEAPSASDLNGNGRYADTLAVIVTRAQNGVDLVDMDDLISAGARAFSDDGIAVATAETMRRALVEARRKRTLEAREQRPSGGDPSQQDERVV